jgi:hypothetical protein
VSENYEPEDWRDYVDEAVWSDVGLNAGPTGYNDSEILLGIANALVDIAGTLRQMRQEMSQDG